MLLPKIARCEPSGRCPQQRRCLRCSLAPHPERVRFDGSMIRWPPRQGCILFLDIRGMALLMKANP